MIYFDKDIGDFFSTLLDDRKIIAGFGTKKMGDGLDYYSIVSFAKENLPSYKSIIVPDQMHTTKVLTVVSTETKFTISEQADGIVTSQSGVVDVVLTADCVPIIFADSTKNIVGISHQGWKGTLNGMVPEMIGKMENLGATKENIIAVIGPCINDCCYEIYGERFDLFSQKFSQYPDIFRKDVSKSYLNLAKLNYYLLIEAGISKNHIDHFPFCTSCDSERFYSYHRDKEIKGEMMNFIVIQ